MPKHDFWHLTLTLTYNPNLAKVKVNLYAKYQGRRANCLAVRGRTYGRTDRRTDATKYIISPLHGDNNYCKIGFVFVCVRVSVECTCLHASALTAEPFDIEEQTQARSSACTYPMALVIDPRVSTIQQGNNILGSVRLSVCGSVSLSALVCEPLPSNFKQNMAITSPQNLSVCLRSVGVCG